MHFASLRSPSDQFNSTVRINEFCGGHSYSGSGVLVSGDLVLTAEHATTCKVAGSDAIVKADAIVVVIEDGVFASAKVDVTLPGVDIARLKLERSFDHYFSDVRVGPPPGLGEKVCESSAAPRETYRCGPAQPTVPGRITVDFMVEHGNSGSGMYNIQGELVGIITNQYTCENGQICAGFGSALAGYAWLVP